MPRIDDYSFGRIVVDGREEARDVILLPDRVVHNWWRRDGHALVWEDLEPVADDLPQHLVIGTGALGRMRPDPEVVAKLLALGIDVESMVTPQAVERYRTLDPSRTAAAFHLTC